MPPIVVFRELACRLSILAPRHRTVDANHRYPAIFQELAEHLPGWHELGEDQDFQIRLGRFIELPGNSGYCPDRC